MVYIVTSNINHIKSILLVKLVNQLHFFRPKKVRQFPNLLIIIVNYSFLTDGQYHGFAHDV
ncbi:hypothetical protein LEQ41_08175 [Streptococcus agalactiae]|nr:hypothetical protein [Streptococcus agalactiae]